MDLMLAELDRSFKPGVAYGGSAATLADAGESSSLRRPSSFLFDTRIGRTGDTIVAIGISQLSDFQPRS